MEVSKELKEESEDEEPPSPPAAALPPKEGETKNEDPVSSPPGGGAEQSEAEGADSDSSEARGAAAELPVATVTLAEFQAAWPAIVARIRTQFGARRHAFVKVAEPKSVENGIAVLTMPTHQHFHLEQLNADRELLAALSDIAAELLGGSIILEFQADDSPGQPTEAEPERAPDKDRLIEEGSSRDDPADLIADMLGGEVVSE